MIIKDFNLSSTPYFLVIVDSLPITDELTSRVISLEVEFDDDKEDMLSISFDNRDYYLSNSPFIERNKKISVLFGYPKGGIQRETNFIIKDYEGIEEFKIMAYRGPNTTTSDNVVKENTSTGNHVTGSGDGMREQPVPPSLWNRGTTFNFSYKSTELNNIILFVEPSVKTNNVPSGTQVQGLTEEKGFFDTLIEGVGQKLGVSKEIQGAIKTAGHWVIDGYTGVETFVAGKAGDLLEKVLPDDLNPFKNNQDDITGGLQGGNEITTECNLTTIGLPPVRNGINIGLENIGKKFSGKWYVKSVSHKFSEDGYKTEYKLLRPTKFFGGGSSFSDVRNVNNNNNTNINQSKAQMIVVDGFTGAEYLSRDDRYRN